MADGFTTIVKGLKECEAALIDMEKKVTIATSAATKKTGQIARSTVKAQMRGRPRWDRRGKSSRTGPEVNLHLSPHHVTKSSGPGKLSGALSRAVRMSRKPRAEAEGFSIAVFVGGAGGPQNLYKGKVEAKAPYFKPGINKAIPKMSGVYTAAWAKATARK